MTNENTSAPEATVLPAGKAKGVTRRTAPHTAKHVEDTRKASRKAKAPAKAKRKVAAKAKPAAKAKAAPKAKAAGVITTVEIAAAHSMSAKTLRARIRRNIDAWEPLFKDGEKHVFADNKTTRAKIDALLS